MIFLREIPMLSIDTQIFLLDRNLISYTIILRFKIIFQVKSLGIYLSSTRPKK